MGSGPRCAAGGVVAGRGPCRQDLIFSWAGRGGGLGGCGLLGRGGGVVWGGRARMEGMPEAWVANQQPAGGVTVHVCP